MPNYQVTLNEIEWDTGKDPISDGYDLDYISKLPKEVTRRVYGPDAATALAWCMGDVADDYCFNIQGCKTVVKVVKHNNVVLNDDTIERSNRCFDPVFDVELETL